MFSSEKNLLASMDILKAMIFIYFFLQNSVNCFEEDMQ